MRKYILFIILVALTVAAACNKNKRNDLGGDFYLRARLVVADITKKDSVLNPVPKDVKVMIGIMQGGAMYYFNTASTDDEGYFIFEHLSDGVDYTLKCEYKKDSVLYALVSPLKLKGSVADGLYGLTLSQQKQNGIVYIVTDAAGQAVQTCNVCMFSNAILANDTCAGSNINMASNSNGRAIRLNIPSGRYVSFFKLFDVNKQKYEAKDTIDVPEQGIVYKAIQILPAKPVKAKGLQFVVRDTAGGIIKDCTVCLFTSSALANDSCNGHYASKSTGADGKVMFDALPVGNIYSYFKITAGSKTLKANVVVSYADTGLQIIDTVRVR